MAPEIPQGREAREAWRALSPQAREVAFAAAKRGVAPADPGIAWAAAGYGRLMARRLRILRLFVPFLFVLLVLPVARSLGLRSDAVLSGLCIVVLAGLVALVVRAGRYQRLHSSGLLGIQAAGLGMALTARGLLADGGTYRIRQGIELGRPSLLSGKLTTFFNSNAGCALRGEYFERSELLDTIAASSATARIRRVF